MRKLRRLRAEKGLTMDALEERTGVSKRTISEIERGMRDPQPLTLAKLANALEADIDDLLEEESPKAPSSSPIAAEQAGEERRENTEIALATLADHVALRGETLADALAASEGEFSLTETDEFIREAWALRVMHDKEPPAVQRASRVQEAMERFEAADRQLSPLVSQWFSSTKLSPDQWGDRRQFSARRAESQRRPEVKEGPTEKATENGA